MTTLPRKTMLIACARLALPLFALLPACRAMPAAGTADVLASQPARCDNVGEIGAGATRGQAFLNAVDWRAHLENVDAALRGALTAWDVDFTRGQSVALVRAGSQPNPGYRVVVEQKVLPVQARTVRVSAIVEPPPGQSIQAQVIAFPCVYLKLGGEVYEQVEVQLERRLPDRGGAGR